MLMNGKSCLIPLMAEAEVSRNDLSLCTRGFFNFMSMVIVIISLIQVGQSLVGVELNCVERIDRHIVMTYTRG